MDLAGAFMWMLPTCLVVWITYRYITAPADKWKQQGIPCSPGWTFFTGIADFILNPFHELLLRNYRRYGRLYGDYFFGICTLTVGDPDLIREILVKDFQHFVDRLVFKSGDPIVDNMVTTLSGEKWKRMRTVMSPTFSTGKIKKMTSTVKDCAETVRKNMEKAAEAKEPIDVKKLIGAFSMDTIASTAFSTKVDSHNDPENPFVVAAAQFFTRRNQWRTIIVLTLGKLLKLLRIKVKNVMASRFFVEIAERIIEERRKRPNEARNDFLQLMLNASENSMECDENEKTPSEIKDDGEHDVKTEAELERYKGLSDEEIISQCVIFFVGAFETVASTISFALYELALHEECQEALIAEIDEILLRKKNELKYEDIQEMKYLDCIVSETLRKYPPAAALQRTATDDCTIGDKKIKIPKGTLITIPVYGLHNDPEYFPDPEKFDPNRFLPEERAARNPYVYLPFGAGPRNCIAMRFALTEVKLCLAHLLQHFRFHRCSSTPVPLKFDMGQPQILAKNIFISVQKREDAITSAMD